MTDITCTCGACVVPLVEITGPVTAEQAQSWAYRARVELRSTWDGRFAVGVDHARAVHERALAAAEAARARNQAKATVVAEAAWAGIRPGRPAPEGLAGDLKAVDVMLQDKHAERLDKADEIWQEYTQPGTLSFHSLGPEQD